MHIDNQRIHLKALIIFPAYLITNTHTIVCLTVTRFQIKCSPISFIAATRIAAGRVGARMVALVGPVSTLINVITTLTITETIHVNNKNHCTTALCIYRKTIRR
jgi:hypothetical protein